MILTRVGGWLIMRNFLQMSNTTGNPIVTRYFTRTRSIRSCTYARCATNTYAASGITFRRTTRGTTNVRTATPCTAGSTRSGRMPKNVTTPSYPGIITGSLLTCGTVSSCSAEETLRTRNHPRRLSPCHRYD